MAENMPSVAIVVVNYNGLDHSKECIDSLLQIEYENYTIVFIDNGSTDGSGDLAKTYYGDKIVYLPLSANGGVTAGNNTGIDYALKKNYEFILFLNNDTVVEKPFLNELIGRGKQEDVLVVPKIVCYYDRTRLDHYVGTDFNWLTAHPKGYVRYPLDGPEFNVSFRAKVSSTCCLLAPVKLIQEIGKMDEQYFMYQDDSDFTIRASRAGYPIIYEPESVIYHKCNMTTRHKQPSYFEFYLQYRNFFHLYDKLCRSRLIKTIFLTKCVCFLLLSLLKAYLINDRHRIKVIQMIYRDVRNKKMGPPPKLNLSGD
jgi:GT2 family glycosyltransferase